GKANLGGLSVTGDAKVSILGSGDASLSPHGTVRLFIAGSGNLQLLTRPSDLRQTIVGSGEVSQLAGEAAKEALKSQDIARTARESAREAAQEAVNENQVNEQVRRQVERQIERHWGPPVPPFPPGPPEVLERDGKVVVPGYKNVDLGHVERDSLTITIANSGSLTAEGKVDHLRVDILGSGQANLAKLSARTVTVMVMGSGSATVAPREELKANIMGSGDIHLATRPAGIERSIMGSCRVIEEH
ncbi:MAG TPA: DUF2807 domain-containing protein, partial [Rhizomicrobium sp.]|nr:DUF2807 domain-containing protein [Rhizomicrobium sp.]